MARVYATGIPAKMIRFKPLRNRPDQAFISPSVSKDYSISLTAKTESSIAERTFSGCPFPAETEDGAMNRHGSDTHLRPETFCQRRAESIGVAPTSPSEIVLVTPATNTGGVAAIGDGTLNGHRKVTPFGVMQPEVFGLAAASFYHIRREQ